MSPLTFEQLGERIQQIPLLPQVVSDVQDILQQVEVDLELLEWTLHKDMAIVARVLRLANSPFYGLSGEISSIHEACLLLGMHTIRNVVTTAGVMMQLPADGDGLIDRKKLWEHSMGTAVAARVIASHAGFDQENAFTGGMLHDIGKLVMDRYFHSDYQAVLHYQVTEDCLLREAETAVLGFDHSIVGARAAQRWRFPASIVEAIEHHHEPDKNAPSKSADIIHVADILCRGLEIGYGGDPLIPILASSAAQRIKLDWDNLEVMLQEIEELYSMTKLI